MFQREFWMEIGESLWRHKLRSALTAFSVFWGMLMLVLLLGSGNGLRRGVEFQFKDDAINSIWIWPGTTSMPWRGLPTGRDMRFRNAEVKHLQKTEPLVDKLTARYHLRGTFAVSRGDQSTTFRVRSVHPDHRFLENTVMLHGRFINPVDLEQTRKVCAIGTEVRDFFFAPPAKGQQDFGPPPIPQPGVWTAADSAAMGRYLTVKGVPYQIVGIFHDQGSRGENQYIYLPISTAQKIEGGTDRVDQIMFTFGNASLAESREVEARLREDFARRLKFDPDDQQAIYISNDLEEFKRFQGLFNGIEAFVWVIGILSLIAGMIGIANIMLITVNERTREIGVRKALGATNGSLVRLILLEAIVLTALSGFMGMALGVGTLWLVDTQVLPPIPEPDSMFMHPGVTPGVVVGALSILIGSGALAGFIPAIKAVRIAPAVAMKSA